MFSMRKILALALIAAAAGLYVSAADAASSPPSRFRGAFLDPPRKKHAHPRLVRGRSRTNQVKQSNSAATIRVMSPVRSQASRGTCSIFSATALTEGYLARWFGADSKTVDLSEQWLQYLVNHEDDSDGSFATVNLSALLEHGTTEERAFPYIGETWKSIDHSSLARERCGGVPAELRKSCLIVHRDPRLMAASDAELGDRSSPLYDPEFLAARRSAQAFRARYLSKTRAQTLYDSEEIRKSLLAGNPVILEVDFFYGAWNHSKAPGLGIPRSAQAFERGEVGYPEPGSVDQQISRQGSNRSGHSILLVGYDDTYEMKVSGVKMRDGTTKDFTYRGAYLFKNSWGTDVFGSNFTYAGARYPGYGVITYAYAHQYGTFDTLLPPSR